MEKSIIKKIITENNALLKKIKVSHRDYIIEDKANYVFCGVRRCGKSYHLYHEILRLIKSKTPFVFINFEDERFIDFNVSHFDLIIECAFELYGKCMHFFFDEIHNIDGWEKFARRLADSQYRVFISGSNAKMLSKEIGSTLGGRFMIQEIYPLSFYEFLNFHNLTLEKNYEFSEQRYSIKKLFASYFCNGGFPELVHFSNPRAYLNNIYMKVFYGDLIARNNIQNSKVLRLLIKKLAESVNNETSLNRIKNLIQSTGLKIGSNTIPEYLQFLNDAYLIYPLQNYVSQFTERESKKKYYFVDQGILNLFITDQDSKLLENIVFLHLYKKYGDRLFYYKRKYEVDFYIPDESLLIQASYSIADIETEKREIKALEYASKELNAQNTKIITYDEEKKIGNCEVVSVWKWLLED